jgi:hypothetical protein
MKTKVLTMLTGALALTLLASGGASAGPWGQGRGGPWAMRHAGQPLCAPPAICPRRDAMLAGRIMPGGRGLRDGTGPRAQLGLCPLRQPAVNAPESLK